MEEQQQPMQSNTFHHTDMALMAGDEEWDDEVFEEDFDDESEEVFEDEWDDDDSDEDWDDSSDSW